MVILGVVAAGAVLGVVAVELSHYSLPLAEQFKVIKIASRASARRQCESHGPFGIIQNLIFSF
jgi:hypothetical protein